MSNFFPSPFDIDVDELLTKYPVNEANQVAVRALACDGTFRMKWAGQGCFGLVKALVFLDKAPENIEIIKSVLAATSPSICKGLGRKVNGFDPSMWSSVCYTAMVYILEMKFSQNLDIRAKLIDTGDAILVEATKYDKIWSIGLGILDPDVHNPKKWKGQNLLGKALMDVRSTYAP